MSNTRKTAPPTRAELVEHVRLACELEHSLCCQYLYSIFSLRRLRKDLPADLDEGTAQSIMAASQRWGAELFAVARGEMEHLAIATNLLTALGERPFLQHAPFPDDRLGAVLRLPCWLERLSEDVLRRYQYVERPGGLDLPRPSLRAWSQPDTNLPPVEAVYLAIEAGFDQLPAEELFQGNGQRQFNQASALLGSSMQIMPITSRATANSAITLILQQGEGLGEGPTGPESHFASFSAVLDGYLGLKASLKGEDLLSLPVAKNPVRADQAASRRYKAGEVTLITNPYSQALMGLFDQGYRLMLEMLQEFFWGYAAYAGPPEVVASLQTRAERLERRRVTIMLDNAFFPFMTMFVRPVGELLARQPAGDPQDPGRAGAAFDTGGPVPTITDMSIYLDGLQELSLEARRLAHGAPDADTRATLQFLFENLHRMHINVADLWRGP